MLEQQIAASPTGVRGYLIAYRDEATGVAAEASGAAAVASTSEPATAGTSTLPSFFGGNTMQASLSSHCDKVNLATSKSGGFITASSMTDPMRALDEQFCVARSHAIVQGEEMAGRAQGYTPQQVAQQCESFGPALLDHIAALSMQPAAEVIAGVRDYALSTGMPPAQLADTAKICLAVGYRTDNMDVALGSTALLAALGEHAYGELMGYHLIHGFGTGQRPDLALAWYDMGLDSLAQQGGTGVFASDQPDRGDLMRKAVYEIGGNADRENVATAAPASLPNFGAGGAPAAMP